MSIYNDVEKPEESHPPQNIFRNQSSPASESSDANTFMSAPKFGGAATNSERGSVTHSFRSPYFNRVDQNVNENDPSIRDSSGASSNVQETFQENSENNVFHF